MPTAHAVCHCVICQDVSELDARTRLSVAKVGEYGWQVVMVPADDQGPGWAYTIGLWHSHRMPELAMFGLDIHLMHTLLNDLARRAVVGPGLAAGQEIDDLTTVPLVLKAVDYRWYRAFFGTAIGYYRRPPFPFLQVAWPNREGLFPWQPGGEGLLALQPRLSLHPGDHPIGIWTQEL
ncbi:DUF4262 domain-containing protein [Streptomyces sp. MAI_2237]